MLLFCLKESIMFFLGKQFPSTFKFEFPRSKPRLLKRALVFVMGAGFYEVRLIILGYGCLTF